MEPLQEDPVDQEQPSQVSFLKIAMSEVARGCKVIPLPPGGKRPDLAGWPDPASNDPEQIKRWADECPDSNCGVVTSKLSEDGIWIWDVDNRDWFFENYPYRIPETFCVATGGGGLQFRFSQDEYSRAQLGNRQLPNPNYNKLNPGDTKAAYCDILFDRRQGLSPGSVHPNGNLYTIWIDKPRIAAPKQLVDWIVALFKGRQGSAPVPPTINRVNRGTDIGAWLASGGLKFERSEKDGKTYFNYHSLAGRCLVRGASHAAQGEIPNPRQCAFVHNTKNNDFWHQCFSTGCYVPGKTRIALKAIGLRLDDVLEPKWRRLFQGFDDMPDKPCPFLIEGLLPAETPSAIAGLSGHYKTFISLSIAKGLIAGPGTMLWGAFKVLEKTPVLYLVPESSTSSFRHRMKLMGLDKCGDDFLVRTFSMGPTLSLQSQEVMDASVGRIVFLDTTIRFVEGDENSASENQKGLAAGVFALLANGAKSVFLLHHSAKGFASADSMDLQNVVRGSGDIGAILGAAYGVKMLNMDEGLLHIECIKPRDFEPPKPFQLQGRPYIDQEQDLQMIAQPGECGWLADNKGGYANRAAEIIKKWEQDKSKSGYQIAEELSVNRKVSAQYVNRILKDHRAKNPQADLPTGEQDLVGGTDEGQPGF